MGHVYRHNNIKKEMKKKCVRRQWTFDKRTKSGPLCVRLKDAGETRGHKQDDTFFVK